MGEGSTVVFSSSKLCSDVQWETPVDNYLSLYETSNTTCKGGRGNEQHQTRGGDTFKTFSIFLNHSNQDTGTPAGWDQALRHKSLHLQTPGESPHSCDKCCRVLGACAEGTPPCFSWALGHPGSCLVPN